MTPTEPPPLTRARTALAGLGDGLGAGLGAGRSEAVALAAIALAGVVVLGLVVWGQRPPAAGMGAVASVAGMDDGAPAGTGLVLTPLADEVVVHVAGLVRSPGLHRLPVGARVADALETAGGPLPEAWLEALNLARPLTDGEQLLVPGQPSAEEAGPALPGPGAGGAGGAVAGGAGGGIRADGTVDLNRATVAELETLPGVGPVLAQRLVDHREANGPFTAVGQLRDVRGIGEKTFQALADLVSV